MNRLWHVPIGYLCFIAIVLSGCASRRADQDFLNGRINDYQMQVENFNEAVRTYNRDFDEAKREQEILSKHPAYPRLLRKAEEAAARAFVEFPANKEQQGRRQGELFLAMDPTPDELALLRVVTTNGDKWRSVNEQGKTLDASRRALAQERDLIMAEIESRQRERTRRIEALATWGLIMNASRPSPSYPTRCTTNYVGSMAFTNCQ